jgi:flavin-dependent dehydrogenase
MLLETNGVMRYLLFCVTLLLIVLTLLLQEKRVVAPIRCGGIAKSYGKQVLIVGDAAGHVDPLTGEGIHTAIVAGKIAAETVSEMFQKHNFSLHACRAYGRLFITAVF